MIFPVYITTYFGASPRSSFGSRGRVSLIARGTRMRFASVKGVFPGFWSEKHGDLWRFPARFVRVFPLFRLGKNRKNNFETTLFLWFRTDMVWVSPYKSGGVRVWPRPTKDGWDSVRYLVTWMQSSYFPGHQSSKKVVVADVHPRIFSWSQGFDPTP